MEIKKVEYRPLFIDGKWVEPKSGRKKDIICPGTGEVIGSYALADPEDVNAAITAAQNAYDTGWNETSPAERAALLLKLADASDVHAEEIAQLESMDTGKPISVARGEVLYFADVLRYYAGICRMPEGKSGQEYNPGVTSIIRREPLGVTAGITPWNYPYCILGWKIGPALGAGNTSVIKPASDTPLSTLYFAEIAKDILPPGVLNVVTGSGSVVGEAISNHPAVQLISMTGSNDTGKHIAEVAGKTLKRVHLELGGKAPIVVFEDADLDALAATLRDISFRNAGQNCGHACRLIVADKIYDEVVERMVAVAESLKVGNITDPDTEMGPLISAAHREDVDGFVKRAVSAGAVVRTGGKAMDGNGFYYAPTIITDCKQDSEIVQDEVFGPVVTIQKFQSKEEALFMANDVAYGLSGSVWTSDIKTAMLFARKMEYGTVGVNSHSYQALEMPWGGFKDSGTGADMSPYSIEEYTRVKHIAIAL